MATYRCPKHDVVFETHTDSRPPGSRGNKSIADQPDNCHPDCPQVETVKTAQPAGGKRVIG